MELLQTTTDCHLGTDWSYYLMMLAMCNYPRSVPAAFPLRRPRLLHVDGLSIVALVYYFSRLLGVHKREDETQIRYSERISEVLQHHLPHQLLIFFLSSLRRRPLCTYAVCNISEKPWQRRYGEAARLQCPPTLRDTASLVPALQHD